ncbi:MAG: 1-phosphofructokinase [Oscillospiraceae bacterium]|nr:1-phosphofructokinase [Oscillospiraceae bacterium]
MIYTVTLNPALDYVMQLPSLLPGDTNRAEGEELQVGGKGINVSLVLAQLGLESTALGFLAGDTGKLLHRRVEELGLRTDFLFLPAGQTRINVKVKGGLETELNGRGPDVPPQSMEALLARLDALRAGDTLILSGSLPPSLSPHTYGDILAHVAGKAVRCVVDAAGEPLLNALPYGPFLVKPNLEELSGLVGESLSPTDLPALTRAAQQLRRQGAENVLVSLGGSGALLAAGDGAVHLQPAPQGLLKNSVGSGDSMVAGFLAAYPQGYQAALRLSVAAGSATAFSMTLASGPEIHQILRQLS